MKGPVTLVAIWGPVAAFLLFTLSPVYWLLNSSLKGAGELFTFPPRYWPAAATVANYLDEVRQTRLAALYLNSLWISSVTCLALMALIVFAGYAMARFRFRGKAWLVALFLLAQVLPHVVLLLPFFTMFQVAGLINTRLALVVAYTVITLPFSVLTMRGFFAAIPVELEVEASRRLPEPIEAAAYYVVSEALTNAAKHSQASAVQVAVASRDGFVDISITDDGVGGAVPGPGSGLIGLKDRVEALGGQIEIDSPSGSGTSLRVRFPPRPPGG